MEPSEAEDLFLEATAFGQIHAFADLRLLPDGENAILLAPFEFIDAQGVLHVAPKGMLTDGASIPPWLRGIAGSPFKGFYRRPAIIHDKFCHDRSDEVPSWRAHEIFYEAMRAAGVSRFKAWRMYTAVRMFGPRWGPPRPKPKEEETWEEA